MYYVKYFYVLYIICYVYVLTRYIIQFFIKTIRNINVDILSQKMLTVFKNVSIIEIKSYLVQNI